jgi:hypothetical protein
LHSNKFDLVILAAMLSSQEKRRIQAKLPAGTRPLVLETLVMPDELLRIGGRGPRMKASFSNSARHAGAAPSSTIFFPRGGAPRERNQPCGQGG